MRVTEGGGTSAGADVAVEAAGLTVMVSLVLTSPPSPRATRVYSVVVSGATLLLPGATTPSSVPS
jgi:hypothetical protein